MRFARVFFVGGLLAAVPLRAVYAPLPEQDQEKDWTVTLRTGVSHDSNIFGAPEPTSASPAGTPGPISSLVYEAAPTIAFNGSLSDRTFAALGYTATVDHFVDRPGDKTLDSHDLLVRLAHAFSPAANIDVSDQYQIVKNPESLLAGLPVNTDQSFKRNEANARLLTSPRPKLGATLKARSVLVRYDNAVLGRSLDRIENLFGGAASYDLLPELKWVGEYRHEDIYYRKAGELKNKRSDFLIGGADYAIAKKFALTGRLGGEWRQRAAEQNASAPYAEFSAKYDYAPRSFLAAGYVYAFEETSNVALYNDTQVSRVFVNVQHAVSGLVFASASATYEPSQLQGRRGVKDIDETTTRLGVALTWLPTKHWAVSGSFDYDNVRSDDPNRGQRRERFGLGAAYTF